MSKMNTGDDNNIEVSITDETVTSEMCVKLTPISQIGETSAIELNTVQITPISTQDENKTDDTAAMMQLLLNKFDEKFSKLDEKLDEQKSDSNVKYNNLNDKFDEVKDEIKRQSFDFSKQINEIHTRYENIQEQIIEVVSEKFNIKIII